MRILCAMLAIGVQFVSVLALAQVDEGRERYLEADFRRSVTAFEQALESPDLTRREAIESHRYLATLHQFLDDHDAAAQHAAIAVALNPDVTPPAGAPPEVAELFQDARSQDGRRAAIEIEHEGDEVVALVVPELDGFGHELSLECGDLSGVAPPPRLALQIGSVTGALDCAAELATESGAVLLSSDRQLRLEGTGSGSGAIGSGQAVPEGGPSPWPWIIAGFAVLAGGLLLTYFLVTADQDPTVNNITVVGW